ASLTSISRVLRSGSPKKEAGPVTEKRAPILNGSAANADEAIDKTVAGTSSALSIFRNIPLFLHPVETCTIQNIETFGEKGFYSLLRFIKPEDNHCICAAPFDKRIHVFDIYRIIVENMENAGQSPRLIRNFDCNDLGLADSETLVFQGVDRFITIIDDQPQNTEIGCICKRQSPDID